MVKIMERIIVAQELDSGDRAFIENRKIDIASRLQRARSLVRREAVVVVPLAQLVVCDGQGVPDKHLSQDELKRIMAEELGFPVGQYEEVTPYDARTASTRYPDLTLQLLEGPLELGGPSEAFPDGRAWSTYDHVLDVNVLVEALET